MFLSKVVFSFSDCLYAMMRYKLKNTSVWGEMRLRRRKRDQPHLFDVCAFFGAQKLDHQAGKF